MEIENDNENKELDYFPVLAESLAFATNKFCL